MEPDTNDNSIPGIKKEYAGIKKVQEFMIVSEGCRNQPFFCSARPFPKYNIKSEDFLFCDKELRNVGNLIGLINPDMKR